MSVASRRLDQGQEFIWATGVEDTFIPQTKRGHRALDEYALVGHYEHWREDLALAKSLGVQAIRWGVPWYRVQPRPNQFDWTWTDEVIPYLVRELGISPIIDLMHYGCPLWLEGEFINPHYADAVATYAAAFARRYHDLVSWYTPLNEPLMNSLWCGKRGLWPPYLRGDTGYVRLMMQLASGIVRTVEAIKAEDADSVMVHVEVAGRTRAEVPELTALAEEAQTRMFLSYDLINGRVDASHPLFNWLVQNGASLRELTELRRHAITLDVIGLNFYPQWSTTEMYLDRDGRMRERVVERDGVGFAELIDDAYRRYGVPVMVTETSARGYHAPRLRWLRTSLAAVKTLRERGVPVIGYTWFPLMTMFRWHYRFGTQPLDAYRDELGLYVLNGSDTDGRWKETPLAQTYRDCISHAEQSVGRLALPVHDAKV